MIAFWLEYPLMHFSPLIKALSNRYEGKVFVICEKDIPRSRKDMGFVCPDFGEARVYLSPEKSERRLLIDEIVSSGGVNIFHGFSAYPKNYKSMKEVERQGGVVVVNLEAQRFSQGIKGWGRRLKYILLMLRWRKSVSAFLLHGELGVRQFSSLMCPVEKVFQFGYFSFPGEGEGSGESNIGSRKFRVIFVGSLTKNKRVSDLLFALSALEDGKEYLLSIVGDGPERVALTKLSAELGVSRNVEFLGYKDHLEVLSLYKQSDLLVLPSDHDGWGAVCNEAASCGCRLIVSDGCGSYVMGQNAIIGGVFRSNDASDLASKIERMYSEWAAGSISREDVMKEFSQNFSAELAASYLLEIVKWVRGAAKPLAPWQIN